jgi:hypothetical protein
MENKPLPTTIIELTDSQIKLLKEHGNRYYNNEEEWFNLPYWFKSIEGNKFEVNLPFHPTNLHI